MKKLSFVIPCYCSSQTITKVVSEIKQTVGKRSFDYEIILVNDRSPDNTFSVISELCDKDKKIIGIDLAKNFGQHSALMAGFLFVTGDIIVCLDDDGQTPACEAFSLINNLDGYDVAIAKYPSKKHNLFRNLGSKLNDIMASYLIGKPYDLKLASYFACKRFVVNEMLKYKNPYPYVAGLILRTTSNITNVEINHRERKIGKSGYTFKKMLSLWLNGFTAFSVKPLRLATVLGFVVAVIGFLYGGYTVINKLVNPAIPLGYSSTMAAILFVGGIVMLMLGMIGEYIGRIYISLNNAPQYVIREKKNIDD